MRFSAAGIFCTLALALLLCACDHDENIRIGKSYFISGSGNDLSDGSETNPWKTLDRANKAAFHPGDSLYLQGGEGFTGTLVLDRNDSGSSSNPIVITSRGSSRAIINSGNEGAVVIDGSSFIYVTRLHLTGTGRKNGNTKNGIEVKNGTGFLLDSIESEGFQKNGVLVQTCSNSILQNIYAHDNGAGGIFITGNTSKQDCHHITLRNSRAENNPGDPTELNNHSGNGILAGYCSSILIEYCTATNNGWDMPRIGNGPVGIWTFESDSVVIQHCISYRNKTSKGGEDGGGYDLDGGVTNSTIQYCLSYENQGAGFGIFQYAGASPWHSNTIRYNISENDGHVSAARAGVYIWNGSEIAKDFTDCYFYNNTIYNDRQPAISYSNLNGRQNFVFYNNILMAKDSLMRGSRETDKFAANDWINLSTGFHLEAFTDFAAWVSRSGQEKLKGMVVGLSVNPEFKSPGKASITDPHELKHWDYYSLPENSVLRSGGLDLKQEFGISTGGADFHEETGHPHLIGASF